jgi:hypothetical protein
MSDRDLHPSQPIACTLTPIELATHRNGLLHKVVVSVIEAEGHCCNFLLPTYPWNRRGASLAGSDRARGHPGLPSFAPVQRTRIPSCKGLNGRQE